MHVNSLGRIRLRFASWLSQSLLMGFALSCPAAPHLAITHLPAYGSTNDLSGIATGTNVSDCAVAVFIYVPHSGGWWSRPTCPGQPLTAIRPDGSWCTDITTGGADTHATRIAALLVRTNYSQPCVLGSAVLPTNVFAQAMASAVVTRPSPGTRWLSFSGYSWWVKESPADTPVGPGPNTYSASTNNVWTDGMGRLHLRITQRSNHWQCAEIVSAQTFGHGSYHFELDSPVDNLDANAVLGLFTWSDDPVFANREIDIEAARWGQARDTNNAQFAVQPWEAAHHLVRYRTPPTATNSAHLFVWETNRVSFQAQHGRYAENPTASNVIRSYVFTSATAIPQTGDENVRLNLWLMSGKPPLNRNEVEVIVRSFEFVPLGIPRPAKRSNSTVSPAGQRSFIILTEPE